MSQEELRNVAQVIGQNMRRIRDGRAVVLADVASAARDLGMTWDSSMVSRIETGRRELTLEEFLALPLVMTLALNEPVTLWDLLGAEDFGGIELRSFNRKVSPSVVLPVLAQPFLKLIEAEEHLQLGGGTISDVVAKSLDDAKRRAQARREPAEEREAHREIQELADELEVKVNDILAAMNELWGRGSVSLSHERERRLVKSGADLSRPASVRTMRGHITRQLMTELREWIELGEHNRAAIQRGGNLSLTGEGDGS